MQDFEGIGYRPVRTGQPLACTEEDLLSVCPGAGTELARSIPVEGIGPDIVAANGPTIEVWEGHASDPELRFSGSSGGALSALAAYCLDEGGMNGVLHVGADPDDPFKNRTVLSRTIEELRQNSGSRYAPATVCDGLQRIEDAGGTCAFIGQPSEAAALRKVQSLRPELKGKIGVVMSFFCAGSPPIEGTRELVRSRGIDPRDVSHLRYRGRGWPGNFAVWVKGKTEPVLEMTYAESWAFLQRFRPWSVQIWPDGSGEHADITCGDPWYRKVEPGEAGSSLVVARTETGRQIVRAAIQAGYLTLQPLDPTKLLASQENLTSKKGAVWGRLFAMRLLGIPTPRHEGYSLFAMWKLLPLRAKIASVAGTARRILQRGYHIRNAPLRPLAEVPELKNIPTGPMAASAGMAAGTREKS